MWSWAHQNAQDKADAARNEARSSGKFEREAEDAGGRAY